MKVFSLDVYSSKLFLNKIDIYLSNKHKKKLYKLTTFEIYRFYFLLDFV